MVEGDEDLGGAGIEDIDEVASGGNGSSVNVDIKEAEVALEEVLSLSEAGDLDEDATEVGDLLEGEAGGGGSGVVRDEEGSGHDGSMRGELSRGNIQGERIRSKIPKTGKKDSSWTLRREDARDKREKVSQSVRGGSGQR